MLARSVESGVLAQAVVPSPIAATEKDGAPAKKRARKRKARSPADEDEEQEWDEEDEDGREIVGRVVEAPKTGRGMCRNCCIFDQT